jgi:hypothetical protein
MILEACAVSVWMGVLIVPVNLSPELAGSRPVLMSNGNLTEAGFAT